jgi:hypothetical protein
MTGAELVHVPYRGEALGITDLLAGQVQVMFPSTTVSIPYIRAGALRPLAVTRVRIRCRTPPPSRNSCRVMRPALGTASVRPRTPRPRSSTT